MAIVDDTGTLVAQYEYDSFGKTTVKDASGSIPSSNLFVGNINPFRWKSFYYDVETNFYYANGRYYEVERGGYIDAIEADVVEGNAYSLLGLDRNGIMLLTLLMLAPYSETIATALQLYADPTYNLNTGEEESWWKKHWWEVLVSAVSIVVGVVKIATGNPTGILNILSGITTLVGAIFSQQLAGAMGTAMNVNEEGKLKPNMIIWGYGMTTAAGQVSEWPTENWWHDGSDGKDVTSTDGLAINVMIVASNGTVSVYYKYSNQEESYLETPKAVYTNVNTYGHVAISCGYNSSFYVDNLSVTPLAFENYL